MSTTQTSTPWTHVTGAVLGLTALLSLLLTAFAWPASNTEPRDLPIAVAGPDEVAGQIEQGLASTAGPEAFDVTRLDDQGQAEQAIRDREVYGAIVVAPEGATVLTASAASPAVAQILNQIGTQLAQAQGVTPQVVDVVPLPADDPRGVGLAAGSLPLVLGGIITAGLLTARVRQSSARLAAALAVSVIGGAALTAILQYWLGSLGGDFWLNSAVVALTIAATSTVLLGLERLMGLAGLALGAAVTMLLGNPLSGLTSAPELLPTGWGTLGQLLPPGAGGTALRSMAFFDGAGSASALVVLGAWLAVGLVLSLIPTRERSDESVASRDSSTAGRRLSRA